MSAIGTPTVHSVDHHYGRISVIIHFFPATYFSPSNFTSMISSDRGETVIKLCMQCFVDVCYRTKMALPCLNFLFPRPPSNFPEAEASVPDAEDLSVLAGVRGADAGRDGGVVLRDPGQGRLGGGGRVPGLRQAGPEEEANFRGKQSTEQSSTRLWQTQ